MDLESEPNPQDIHLLEQQLYRFNVEATGICYVRYLFVPADMRMRGYGSRLMTATEAEAGARGCHQIVLETHDFQAPEFYRKLGFEITGGYQYLTLLKRLAWQREGSELVSMHPHSPGSAG
jgi:GNAT superfamily N-acetyltransferase